MNPLLDIACATHPGRVRSQNEDCIAADDLAALAVLADGMGGHNAGEVASRIAVDVVRSGLQAYRAGGAPLDGPTAEALIAKQIAAANATILEAARARVQYAGMGTTLVAAVWHEYGVSFGHVGDSRLYRLRRGTLQRLTRDHSLVQEQLDAGAISVEQARYAPHRNVLTRAVGTDPAVESDVRTRSVQEGDFYLLCSDGLTDMVTDDDIRKTLVSCSARSDVAARHLVESANDRGGFDNVSVIVVRVARAAELTGA
jgi:PPM family protein phosphatase